MFFYSEIKNFHQTVNIYLHGEKFSVGKFLFLLRINREKDN